MGVSRGFFSGPTQPKPEPPYAGGRVPPVSCGWKALGLSGCIGQHRTTQVRAVIVTTTLSAPRPRTGRSPSRSGRA